MNSSSAASAWPAIWIRRRTPRSTRRCPTLGWDRAYRSGDLVRLENRRPVLPGSRRRPGQGRRPPDRAGRGRFGASQPARSQRWRGRGAAHGQRHPAAGRLYRERRSVVRSGCGTRDAGRRAARRTGAASGARGRTAHPDLGQGRPKRAAVAAPRRTGGRRCARFGGHDGLGGGPVARCPGRPHRGSRGRLLRARRRIAVGSPAGRRAASAVSAGDGRRPLRPSPARLAGRISRRTQTATAGKDPGGQTDAAALPSRPGRPDAAPVHADRAAMGGLAGPGQQRRRRTECGAVGGAHRLVVDRRGIPAVRHAAGPDGHRGAVRTDAAVGIGARHLSPGRTCSICGSGSPSVSRRPAVRRTWPVRRGWCTTPAHSATRSARASTCIRRRR